MIWMWIGFVSLVLVLLALDLGVFHHKDHVVKTKESLIWSAIWIGLSLLFSFFIYVGYAHHWQGLGASVDPADGSMNSGGDAVIKYLTGYVLEKSLSVDNIFVIALIFSFFAIPAIYQHRVLFWGIIGALAMRGALIGVGSILIARFSWILYVFGGVLLVTAIHMLIKREKADDPSKNKLVQWARRIFPITDEYHGHHFIARDGAGKLALTPLGVSLIVIEATDLIFAVDSIPAVFAITADPFLVFTSNVFAILGLRSLYFALAGLIDKFRYLKPALAIVLAVVGIKMLAHTPLKAMLGDGFNLYLLALVMLILGGAVAASLWADRHDPKKTAVAA